MDLFLQLDFPMFAAGALAAMACAIIGCFLVLRRMSLMGDAISHAVLPGIVGAFVFTHSLQAMPVFIGCALVGMLTALLSELIHRLGRVEPGAAMGVVFTAFFALGVIWLSQVEADASVGVHLDADCVLYGAMENVIWSGAPETLSGFFTAEPWQDFPRQVTTLAIVLLANVAFVAVFFKELRITSFDPALAASQGFRPGLMHYLLMVMIATTTVAAFEAVGSILVVAMLIVPGLIAHLLTNRLAPLLVVSVIVAFVAAAGGYGAAATLEVNAAGMIGVTLGVLLVIAGLMAPQQGWLARWLRRASVTVSMLREDMLGLLYRVDELAPDGSRCLTPSQLHEAIGGGTLSRLAFWRLRQRDEATLESNGTVHLTESGSVREAANLIRSHRLWETYLVQQLGLRADHVHDTAMELEHITTPALQERLARDIEQTGTDPHGKVIPPGDPG